MLDISDLGVPLNINTDNFIIGGETLERFLLLLIDVSFPDVPLKCSCLLTSTHLLSFSVRRKKEKICSRTGRGKKKSMHLFTYFCAVDA